MFFVVIVPTHFALQFQTFCASLRGILEESVRGRFTNRRDGGEQEWPYALLADPTTEIIILADILANVRMQFYLLLSWETR